MFKSKTLYIIRHGQTDFNKQSIIQGSGIDSDLNVVGRLQAESFFDVYKDYGFETVFTSELKRAIQSVEGFLAMGVNHIVHHGLNEINWGNLEGKRSTPRQRKMFEEMIREWRLGNLEKTIEGGESPLQMLRRQKESFDAILKADAQKILIASHGRALRGLMCLFTGKGLENMHLFPHTNLGLYVLEQVDERKFEVRVKNNTDHLAEALITSHY